MQPYFRIFSWTTASRYNWSSKIVGLVDLRQRVELRSTWTRYDQVPRSRWYFTSTDQVLHYRFDYLLAFLGAVMVEGLVESGSSTGNNIHRKRLEMRLIFRLGTARPRGMNTRVRVYHCACPSSSTNVKYFLSRNGCCHA